MSATLADLARLLLPGSGSLTWADLAEQVALENCLPIEVLITEETRGGKKLAATRARSELFGALRGAGFPYSVIAKVWNLDPSRVRNGVLLASDRLAIARPRGGGNARGTWEPVAEGGAS